jgi:PhnB protein
MRLPDPRGRLIHAQLTIHGSSVLLADEFPEMGNRAPPSLGGTAATMHLLVGDVDAFCERARAAGAEVAMPVTDMFWGDRYGGLDDPFGHRWSIATHQRRPTHEQIRDAAAAAMSGAPQRS